MSRTTTQLGALTLTAKGAGTKADTVAVDVGLAVEGFDDLEDGGTEDLDALEDAP